MNIVLHMVLAAIVRIGYAQCVSGGGNSNSPRTMSTNCVDTEGIGGLTIESIFTNVALLLFNTIFFVSSAAFVIGAFLYVISAFKEENKAKGIEFMTNAVIGLVIVLTARITIQLAVFFIYADTGTP